jgi:hypothetical protein
VLEPSIDDVVRRLYARRPGVAALSPGIQMA